MNKYSYLKKYIYNNAPPPRNWFGKVKLEEIEQAEQKIGFQFPQALREFWLEIGYGILDTSVNCINAFDYANSILKPEEIASIILKEEDAPMLPEYMEYMQEGDIPFFEVADSSSYIFMKINSDKIYYMGLDKIADSLEEFIYKLYYESPAFYLFIGKEDQDPYRIRK